MSLDRLITTAYQLKNYQLSGPGWLNLQRFEINAIMPEGSSPDQVPAMLRAVLEDRFKLKAHLEKKDRSVYALVVPRKENLNLMKADETVYADAKPLSPTHPISIKRDGDAVILINSLTGMVTRGRSDGRGGPERMRTEILKTSMPAFADYLTELMDRPVVDATGLKDFSGMVLEIPRDAITSRPLPADLAAALSDPRNPFRGPGGAPAPSTPSTDATSANASDPPGKAIFAVISKLGLRLDSRKAPIDTLIIEHVEKNPTEN
jgi:uncharacterized protein (TIGR03435 family)